MQQLSVAWLQELADLILQKYNGRLHWGKAGWSGSFDGASTFGNSWCQFGCSVLVSC